MVCVKCGEGILAVIYDLGIKTLFGEIQRNEFCDILVVVDDQYLLFSIIIYTSFRR